MNRLSNELAEERKRFQIELASVKASHDNERRTIFEEHSRYTVNIRKPDCPVFKWSFSGHFMLYAILWGVLGGRVTVIDDDHRLLQL